MVLGYTTLQLGQINHLKLFMTQIYKSVKELYTPPCAKNMFII